MVEKYSFGYDPILCHAWNNDKQQIAITPNSSEVHIYQYDKSNSDWSLYDKLNTHDLRVTGIDWAPKTNRIVTCSEDRDAYVWSLGTDNKWKPTQALLRINRGATCVKWSPDENKFAAGSGARIISVCYFEKANDWWVSKHIKKPIKSSITSIDWHPNNVLLAAGCADFKVKVFSGFIKEIEDTYPTSSWGGGKGTLGTLVKEFNNSPNNGGWIHSVAFSDDGNRLCWVSHDSSVNVADVSQKSVTVLKLKTDTLPFLSCIWINDNTIVAAGHGCSPIAYMISDNQIKLKYKLDKSLRKEATGLSAMKKFQSLDRQAKAEHDTSIETIHQNSITCIQARYKSSNNVVNSISTSGLDGQVIVWKVNDLENSLSNMKMS